jgi:hypothetical protein
VKNETTPSGYKESLFKWTWQHLFKTMIPQNFAIVQYKTIGTTTGKAFNDAEDGNVVHLSCTYALRQNHQSPNGLLNS